MKGVTEFKLDEVFVPSDAKLCVFKLWTLNDRETQ